MTAEEMGGWECVQGCVVIAEVYMAEEGGRSVSGGEVEQPK